MMIKGNSEVRPRFDGHSVMGAMIGCFLSGGGLSIDADQQDKLG